MPPIVINLQNPSEGIIVDLVDDAAAGDFLLVRCYVNGVAVDEEYLVYMIK